MSGRTPTTALELEHEMLRQALVDIAHVANRIGALAYDQMDEHGRPYQSAGLAALLRMLVQQGATPTQPARKDYPCAGCGRAMDKRPHIGASGFLLVCRPCGRTLFVTGMGKMEQDGT